MTNRAGDSWDDLNDIESAAVVVGWSEWSKSLRCRTPSQGTCYQDGIALPGVPIDGRTRTEIHVYVAGARNRVRVFLRGVGVVNPGNQRIGV